MKRSERKPRPVEGWAVLVKGVVDQFADSWVVGPSKRRLLMHWTLLHRQGDAPTFARVRLTIIPATKGGRRARR